MVSCDHHAQENLGRGDDSAQHRRVNDRTSDTMAEFAANGLSDN